MYIKAHNASKISRNFQGRDCHDVVYSFLLMTVSIKGRHLSLKESDYYKSNLQILKESSIIRIARPTINMISNKINEGLRLDRRTYCERAEQNQIYAEPL